jgi:hypothetical protein
MLKTFIIIDLESGAVSTQETTDRMFINTEHLSDRCHVFDEYDATDIEGVETAILVAKGKFPLPGISEMVMTPNNCI